MDKLDTIIVGGGLSGLAVGHFLKKKKKNAEFLILEKGERPGGAVESLHDQGYLAEWGPHGFLDNSEASCEILADTGLEYEAQKAPLGRFVRYICLNGELRLIPQSPQKIIASNLLPLTAKLRVLADLWKKPLLGEQTVARWVEHRFGPALLPFADAVFTGTYAGNFEKLSIDATMPGVRGLELRSGSVLRGLLGKLKEKKKRNGSPKKELPSMVSFSRGMGRLVEGLAEGLPVRCHSPVVRIGRSEGGFEVETEGNRYSCRSLVLALSANQGLKLLHEAAFTEEPPPVARLGQARIANVVLGFAAERAEIPFGFGFLAPESEKRFALGALFSTHMFPGRAPDGHVMLEALVGGRRHPERLELDDAELIERTCDDLSRLLPLPEPPVYARVLRPKHAIPQLELGHQGLLAWRDKLQQQVPGLFVCGFGWEGIGINDMTKTGKRLAAELAAGQNDGTEETEVKKIYF